MILINHFIITFAEDFHKIFNNKKNTKLIKNTSYEINTIFRY